MLGGTGVGRGLAPGFRPLTCTALSVAEPDGGLRRMRSSRLQEQIETAQRIPKAETAMRISQLLLARARFPVAAPRNSRECFLCRGCDVSKPVGRRRAKRYCLCGLPWKFQK